MRLCASCRFSRWRSSPRTRRPSRPGVSLVHVDAEVVSADGRILGGFGKDDFRVLDDGKEQPILHFSAGEDPLDLILLFDISGSMRPKTEEVAAAAGDAVRELRPGDRVAIMAFNSRSQRGAALHRRSRARAALHPRGHPGAAVRRRHPDPEGRLGRRRRASAAEPRTERRRAVLIVTDDFGIRTKSDATVIRELWEADALLTALIVRAGKARTPPKPSTPSSIRPCSRSARACAGLPRTPAAITSARKMPAADFQESMRRIRSRYSIYYATPPAKPGTHRTIRVELASTAAKANPKAKVRARTGYVTPAEPAR